MEYGPHGEGMQGLMGVATVSTVGSKIKNDILRIVTLQGDSQFLLSIG